MAETVPPASISFDEFNRISLKIGRIIEAADHPNAQKLLVLKVDLGGGDVRQLVAGLKGHYEPSGLVGKCVVVVANLQPAVLRGVESKGMLLAAVAGGEVVLVTVEREVPAGTAVS